MFYDIPFKIWFPHWPQCACLLIFFSYVVASLAAIWMVFGFWAAIWIPHCYVGCNIQDGVIICVSKMLGISDRNDIKRVLYFAVEKDCGFGRTEMKICADEDGEKLRTPNEAVYIYARGHIQ